MTRRTASISADVNVTSTHRDRGSATSELVILTPLLILLVLLVVQTALYFHIAHVASAAASEGAAVAAGSGSDVDRAEVAASEFARSLGGHLTERPRAAIDGDIVEVEVHLDIPAIVPFFPRDVVRTAIEPLEEVVIEAER
ncbi:MAG: hypothetical protein RL391_839 [Actinomycetota bacterium]